MANTRRPASSRQSQSERGGETAPAHFYAWHRLRECGLSEGCDDGREARFLLRDVLGEHEPNSFPDRRYDTLTLGDIQSFLGREDSLQI